MEGSTQFGMSRNTYATTVGIIANTCIDNASMEQLEGEQVHFTADFQLLSVLPAI
jgi:hypothetical protein